MNLYTLSRRATSTTHPSLLHLRQQLRFHEAADYSKDSREYQDFRSGRFLELLQNRRVFQRRHILRNRLALGQHAQQTPHDLARARLRQMVAETDFLRLGDRPDFLGDPVAQLERELLGLVAGRARLLEHDEGA